jgi:hypothetical protein
MNSQFAMDTRLEELMALRKLRVSKADAARRRATMVLEEETQRHAQACLQLASAQCEALERQRLTQARIHAGGITGGLLAGALAHCNLSRIQVSEEQAKVAVHVTAMEVAAGGLKSAEQLLSKAQNKSESMQEMLRDAVQARSCKDEMYLEDENDEFTTLQHSRRASAS